MPVSEKDYIVNVLQTYRSQCETLEKDIIGISILRMEMVLSKGKGTTDAVEAN